MKLDSGAVRAWISSGDTDGLAAYLMSGTHHGRPGSPQAVKLGVIGLLREMCSERQLRAWGGELMERRESVARSVACGVVASGWPHDRAATARRIQTLAEDLDWEVREWAAGALSDVLSLDFERGLALCAEWADAGSEASCRAVALALSMRASERVFEQAEPMLRIIARLMPMDGAYLQKNLGPFSLGGGFLSRFPDATLALLRKMRGDNDENTRWNVAMALTTAAARKHAEAGLEILDAFDADERKRIVRAVAKARKNLAR